MKRKLFRLLARLNKLILPNLWHMDPRQMNGLHKAMIAWRYWVTRNAL